MVPQFQFERIVGCLLPRNNLINYVSDLFLPNSKDWNVPLLHTIFTLNNRSNNLREHSVKSSYKLNSLGLKFVPTDTLDSISTVASAPKLKIILWRFYHNFVPILVNLCKKKKTLTNVLCALIVEMVVNLSIMSS
ncbi:hypothetical protein EPI10_006434 [Gossypium australe]|uniref:Reverse transcriptase zinc-binding domain-containing protein n=1 Tax=Gossypium australe TaxID=47621 RepID=A0A5B6WU02_9ROSI|nr:hypothetical protein EPI10_006434 [Gossypium australe]